MHMQYMWCIICTTLFSITTIILGERERDSIICVYCILWQPHFTANGQVEKLASIQCIHFILWSINWGLKMLLYFQTHFVIQQNQKLIYITQLKAELHALRRGIFEHSKPILWGFCKRYNFAAWEQNQIFILGWRIFYKTFQCYKVNRWIKKMFRRKACKAALSLLIFKNAHLFVFILLFIYRLHIKFAYTVLWSIPFFRFICNIQNSHEFNFWLLEKSGHIIQIASVIF